MKHSLVAEIFRSIAELLEIKGDNPFRIRAYRRAADAVMAFSGPVEDLTWEDRLKEIDGVGKDLAAKIVEIAATGRCAFYEELKKTVPEGVVNMLDIPSVGPKTAKLFYDELNIRSVEELRQAACAGKLSGLPGIKEKTVENILKGISLMKKGQENMDLLTASSMAEKAILCLDETGLAARLSVAGSLRRMKETVRDIDILAVSKKPAALARAFVRMPFVSRVLAHGETKSSILTRENIQADLRILPEKSWGSALLYFTGSKNHNVLLRQLAMKHGWKVNEYGLFDGRGRLLASKTEAEIYKRLGLDYIAPEMREDNGEIEAAAFHKLPRLLEQKDIRGDFHSHSTYSDGIHSLEEMARAAEGRGYGYICFTDHSESLRVAHGLDTAGLKKKKAEIDRLNKYFNGFRVLFGAEVEIDSEGGLDYSDDILSRFDVVVGAIHSGFKQSRQQLTRRIVKACCNKWVHIIAHPTGRQWPTREPYGIDLHEIFKVARETNTALEINANPFRLDLADKNARAAKESGVRLAIGTDSHALEHLDFMKFGVGLARRAWLTKKDVLNRLECEAMLKAIKK
jgi:DNA polymerase (family 10)